MSELNIFCGCRGGGNSDNFLSGLDNVQVRHCASWTLSKLKIFSVCVCVCVCVRGGVTWTIFCLRYPGLTAGDRHRTDGRRQTQGQRNERALDNPCERGSAADLCGAGSRSRLSAAPSRSRDWSRTARPPLRPRPARHERHSRHGTQGGDSVRRGFSRETHNFWGST